MFLGDEQLDRAEKLIQASISNRRFYAPSWLDLAEIKLKKGEIEAAIQCVDNAVKVWPDRAYTLWRAAVLYTRLKDKANALRTLRTLWEIHPNDSLRILSVALELEPNAEQMIASVLPSKDGGIPQVRFLDNILEIAIRNKNTVLATAAWNQIPENQLTYSTMVGSYLDFLDKENIKSDFTNAIARLQSQQVDLVNGSFEAPISMDGLGWQVTPISGVDWERDRAHSRDGDYSVRLDFDGRQNLNYQHFSQRLPIVGGQTYILSGYWRGENITTLSRPYIELYSVDEKNKQYDAHVSIDVASWDWREFEIQLSVPEDVWLIYVRVRRNETEALDRLISGSIWLDDVKLRSAFVEAG